MSLLYIGGKAVNTDEDTLIMEYTGENPLTTGIPGAGAKGKNEPSEDLFIEYDRIYLTSKGTYYRITKKVYCREVVELLTPVDAQKILDRNAAYIVTAGYDKALGKPERA